MEGAEVQAYALGIGLLSRKEQVQCPVLSRCRDDPSDPLKVTSPKAANLWAPRLRNYLPRIGFKRPMNGRNGYGEQGATGMP